MSSRRLDYIDWLRGFAVVCMIVWHVVDAWTLPGTRTGIAFATVTTVGGFAAPLFLFLAGVSVALAGHGAMTKAGCSREAASWKVQKRGWQIFLIAHIFRLQSFLLNPLASWSSILKPDILNILGLGLVVAAFCWGRSTSLFRKLMFLAAPALAIVLLTPASRRWLWPLVLQSFAPRLEAYIRPVPGIGVFSAFPWIAYVLAGTFLGTWLAESPTRANDPASQRKLFVAGAGGVAAGALCSLGPSFTGSEFWTTSMSLFLIRIGAMTSGLTAAWLWVARPWKRWESAFVLLGRASLFVYWVHIELAYGVFSIPLHRALPLGQSLVAVVLMTAVMTIAAKFWLNWPGLAIPADLRPRAA